jgi:Membrane domain of membrane-anchored glycerophosphoryl diester phosphodiesterase
MNTDTETVQSDPSAEGTVPAEEIKKSKKNNKKQKEKNSIGAALRLIRKNFFGFFWFEVLYKLLTFSITIPLIRKVSSAVLYFNGISNITNDNFLGMLKHPATWIGMLVSVYILGVMISIEFSGIFAGLHAADCGKKISAGEMFANGLASCTSVFNIKNWMYLVFVIIVMPMASIAETATLTQSFTIPGFILEGINEKWYLQVFYYGGTAALMYLVLRWIYAIPDMNIMEDGFSYLQRTEETYDLIINDAFTGGKHEGRDEESCRLIQLHLNSHGIYMVNSASAVKGLYSAEYCNFSNVMKKVFQHTAFLQCEEDRSLFEKQNLLLIGSEDSLL